MTPPRSPGFRALLLAWVVAGSAGLWALIGAILPTRWDVERRQSIAAPPDSLWMWLASPRRWQEWGAWDLGFDPSRRMQWTGPESGVGAGMRWQSAADSGWMQIIRADSSSIAWEASLGGFGSEGSFTLRRAGRQPCEVIWRDQGATGVPILGAYAALWISYDLSRHMEDRLLRLKGRLEPVPSPGPAPVKKP